MSGSADTLAALAPDAIAARLAGPPAGRAAFIAEAAHAGVAEAQLLYGQLLLDGNGVAADPAAALGWFGRAAAAGNLMALNMVGRCHDLGWGTAPDKARAADCYLAAARRGLDWAMYNYATLLALGEGVAEDKAGALAWLRRAAALGNANAINFVGSFHEDGWATPVDMATARRCYAEAAEGGDFRGRFNHARMLIAAGDVRQAGAWIARLPENATPAFLEKARGWLAGHPQPAVRALAASLPG
ncbi:tetratricopeptide repeat protein [Sphingomonas solaris]|uniref:Sel1 repeat family protein n=1 Tax=Alterirhizorhabdus solaris TaxID=2529389 RepID=A0A558QTW1_9SPHN|nr:tetratricopeptide repeat protein [Sphingomonas solaris]TVV70565.1 sel1 repeat family protein [Sphingomonas solaris]